MLFKSFPTIRCTIVGHTRDYCKKVAKHRLILAFNEMALVLEIGKQGTDYLQK